MNPKNNLSRLKRIGAKDENITVLSHRAILPTSARLDISFDAATNYAIATFRGLSNDDYVESLEQRSGWCDIYGVYRDGLGWFVKLAENDDGVVIISHHAPEKGSVTTVAGKEIAESEPPPKDIGRG